MPSAPSVSPPDAPGRAAPAPRIWALLGPRTGDNNQVMALAKAVGGAVEAKPLRYWPPRLLTPSNRFAVAGVLALRAESRVLLAPPWPDLVIGVGWRSLAAARWIKARSGGRARIVWIGRPRCHPSHLDLVVTTPQYGVPPGPTVLESPVCVTGLTPDRLAEAARAWGGRLRPFPEPRLVLLLGGDSWPHRLHPEDVRAACAALLARAAARGGSVLAVGGRRTPPAVLDAARAALGAAAAAPVPAALLGGAGAENPYAALLGSAAEVAVTADSAAMVSDAVSTNRPVGLVPVRPARFAGAWLRLLRGMRRAAGGEDDGAANPAARALGRAWGALVERGLAGWPRDLWFFWRELERRGLAGTVEAPARGEPPAAADLAAARVRLLLLPPPALPSPAGSGRGGVPPGPRHRGGCGAG